MKNKDDNCLGLAIRFALFPVKKDPQLPLKYPIDDELGFEGIKTPTPVSKITKVEKQNNIAIYVFGWNDRFIVYQLSKQPSELPSINLMVTEKEEKLRYHYTWINSLSRLLHDKTKHDGRKFFCEHCLHGYSREDLLEKNKPECRGKESVLSE